MSPCSLVIPVAPRDEVGGTSPHLMLAQTYLVSLAWHFATEGKGFAGEVPRISSPLCPQGGWHVQAGSAVPWLTVGASATGASTELGVE